MLEAAPMVQFLVAVLAVWRVTHLLAREDGPWALVARLRHWLGAGFFGQLMDCFYCLSVWMALPMAWWLTGWCGDLLFVWLALSGGACLIEKYSPSVAVLHPDSPSS